MNRQDVPSTSLKRQAAERAVEFVHSGMILGLGHGSTAIFALRRIGRLLRTSQLENILGVPCSIEVERQARKMGIPLTTLDEHPDVDLTIDGADEVDPRLDLIKGAGGAFLREKMVAQASRRVIIVVDESKLSPALGTRRPVPVAVVPFGWQAQTAYLESLGARPRLRRAPNNAPQQTDEGHWILDAAFGPLEDPAGLATRLNGRAGIVEHGLFLGLATDVIVATAGGIRHLKGGRSGRR